MTSGIVASSNVVTSHPLWHFALVAGVGALVYAWLRLSEWLRKTGRQFQRPQPAVAAMAVLGLVCAGSHAFVGPEHFKEWIVYGVFFVAASTAQAAWSVALLCRPGRRLLVAGTLGNAGVSVVYVISRTLGIPFGPDALKPETIDPLSLIVTGCEVVIVALGVYLLSHRRAERPAGLVRAQPAGTRAFGV